MCRQRNRRTRQRNPRRLTSEAAPQTNELYGYEGRAGSGAGWVMRAGSVESLETPAGLNYLTFSKLQILFQTPI
jgi:hypothetical protein